MSYTNIGEIVVTVTCFSDTPAKVNVLTVHEKSGVKKTCPVKRITADKHKCTCEYVSFTYLIFRQVSQIVCIKKCRVVEKFPHPREPEQRGKRGGEPRFDSGRKAPLPSTILAPAAPASGWLRMNDSAVLIASGSTIVSGFSIRM